MSGQNNRSLADKRLDSIDHALGRPTNAHDTTRNFFGVEVGCDDAEAMKEDPYWVHTRDFMGTSGFAVSEEGKRALMGYLHDNWTPPKSYTVTWNDSAGVVVAPTRSKAKYRRWLDLDFVGLKFGEFAKTATAHVAQRKRTLK
jgi:hypothetical protein